MTTATRTAIAFFVAGRPQTKGSMIVRHRHGSSNGMGRCTCQNWVTEMAGGRLAEWNDHIARQAARAMKGAMPIEGAATVRLTFYFPRPVSHTKAQRQSPWVAVNKRYDIEKLVRSVHDALTQAAVWIDDGLACELHTSKRYADETAGERPGVWIEVEERT